MSADPDTTFYTGTMARVHATQGNWQQAAEIYRYLLDQDPDREDLAAALAEAQERATRVVDLYDLVPLIGRWTRLLLNLNGMRSLHRLRRSVRRIDAPD